VSCFRLTIPQTTPQAPACSGRYAATATACPALGPRQRHRTIPRPCPLSYVPSGQLSPLSSTACFHMSASKAFRPSARANSSTGFCNPPTWLLRHPLARLLGALVKTARPVVHLCGLHRIFPTDLFQTEPRSATPAPLSTSNRCSTGVVDHDSFGRVSLRGPCIPPDIHDLSILS